MEGEEGEMEGGGGESNLILFLLFSDMVMPL